MTGGYGVVATCVFSVDGETWIPTHVSFSFIFRATLFLLEPGSRVLPRPSEPLREYPGAFLNFDGLFYSISINALASLKYLSVIDVSFNQMKGMLYPRENPVA